ncbi:MAG: hypothetical protein EPO08_03545 [Rhodospirillaceae bacterium]|nr:MAG: hypothetical protein EPO08_03545 [Rhodospirillaceae bacterium]
MATSAHCIGGGVVITPVLKFKTPQGLEITLAATQSHFDGCLHLKVSSFFLNFETEVEACGVDDFAHDVQELVSDLRAKGVVRG